MTQRNQNYRSGPAMAPSSFVPPTDAEITQVIAGGDPELLVKIADKVGKELAEQRGWPRSDNKADASVFVRLWLNVPPLGGRHHPFDPLVVVLLWRDAGRGEPHSANFE